MNPFLMTLKATGILNGDDLDHIIIFQFCVEYLWVDKR